MTGKSLLKRFGHSYKGSNGYVLGIESHDSCVYSNGLWARRQEDMM
jgi:hypothetical protein